MGTALGRVLGGEGPRDPREVHSVHWYPPGGGGGPKKRHLVLYKLAGFSPADRSRRGAFFSLHSSPLTFENSSKKCKFRPKMAIFAPKNPISGIFGPFFRPFFALFDVKKRDKMPKISKTGQNTDSARKGIHARSRATD